MNEPLPTPSDPTQPEPDIPAISQLLADLYTIEAVYRHNDKVLFSVSSRFNPVRAEKMLRDRLRSAGYEFTIDHADGGPMVVAVNPTPRLRIPTLNIVLFVLTLLSIYIVPVFYPRFFDASDALGRTANSFSEYMSVLPQILSAAFTLTFQDLAAGKGLIFMIAMVSILLVHEMGHFVASRRRGIVTSWPFFIPAPNIIGTFGAVIKSKSPFWNRRDLIEVGAAGPIAGWIVAIGWLIFGLTQSGYLTDSTPSGVFTSFSLEGESVLIKLLVPLLIGPGAEGQVFQLSEAAFAGWVGLLVTAINMLPIGQLDGGHILYGLIRRRQQVFGWLAVGLLLVLGTQSAMWWLFASFGLFFGVAHPPTIQDQVEPSRNSMIMGIIALVILVLSFTPVPFRV